MKVCLKVMGERLLARVAAEVARPDAAFPRQLAIHVPLHWQIEALPPHLTRASLENTQPHAAVTLIEARHAQIIEELWSIGSRDYHAIALEQRNDEQLAPVVVVIERELPTSRLLEMPAIVTDWVNGLDAMHELARRVCAILKRQPRIASRLDNSRLSLVVESRMLCHGDDSILLTPSEVAVAELFLSRFGSVVPMEELQLLFRLAGRSTDGSNVRVTMFQLRFKIEALTHCRYTLTSAYGLGYVLKHGKAGDAASSGRGLNTRQTAN